MSIEIGHVPNTLSNLRCPTVQGRIKYSLHNSDWLSWKGNTVKKSIILKYNERIWSWVEAKITTLIKKKTTLLSRQFQVCIATVMNFYGTLQQLSIPKLEEMPWWFWQRNFWSAFVLQQWNCFIELFMLVKFVNFVNSVFGCQNILSSFYLIAVPSCDYY